MKKVKEKDTNLSIPSSYLINNNSQARIEDKGDRKDCDFNTNPYTEKLTRILKI